MTRRADRRPETAADKRFFDLRESGYTGPIDEQGSPASSEVLEHLRRNDPAQQ